jgi:hypothetical protein
MLPFEGGGGYLCPAVVCVVNGAVSLGAAVLLGVRVGVPVLMVERGTGCVGVSCQNGRAEKRER